MIITLLGSILGFGTSIIPRILGYFEQKRDQAHELALMDKQIEANKATAAQKLQMVEVDADIRSVEAAHSEQAMTIAHASRWMADLSASIRPVVTYLFVLEYLAINWGIAWILFRSDSLSILTLKGLLNDNFMGLLSAMLSFWFGNRTFGKRKS